METTLKAAIGRSEYGLLKYVRVGSEFRFGPSYLRDHKSLADGDYAISAGFLSFEVEGGCKVMQERSMSLGIGPHPEDQKLIKVLWDEFLANR